MAETNNLASDNIYTVAGRTITIVEERDNLLTDFGKQTLKDRYLWKGENYQKLFARVAAVNSDDDAHAQRIYDYISQLWFMPATPVLSNSGHDKNLPISCFLNSVGDSLEEINDVYNQNFWLASRGGGIGTSWNEVRELNAPVADRGKTAGIIPFLKISDSQTLGISQGSLRRGSAAVYLDIDHPEIEEFIDIRKPTGGDPTRKCLNLHHGVNVTNAFMEAVIADDNWHLISRLNKKVTKVVKARSLWQRILTTRLETGEPYIWFVDTVNEQAPASYKINSILNTQSNLCSEITLSTSVDYNNIRRTAVCCLSSMNLETYDQWKDNELIIEDVMKFLDNVLENFIKLTDSVKGFETANYSARQERSVGLGVMGYHGFLQSKMIPFESAMAKVWNLKIFDHIKSKADAANRKLALERGSCPDAERAGILARFSHMLAIAPTASISIIAGESSPGIEPRVANVFKQKTLSGWFTVKNKYLNELLSDKMPDEIKFRSDLSGINWLNEQWGSILENKGSVQHLDYLDELEKNVFKTAMEMDQQWIISHAADRQPKICQGQSVNIFVPANVDKKVLNQLHIWAWKKKLKGLYYLRSKSVRQASIVTHTAGEMPNTNGAFDVSGDGEECLSCQ